jgi:hypothetical protein
MPETAIHENNYPLLAKCEVGPAEKRPVPTPARDSFGAEKAREG